MIPTARKAHRNGLQNMPEYIWQTRYEAALTETDPFRLREHIRRTREAMGKRLGILAIYKHTTARAEYRAITDAENQLKVLERSI